MLKRNLEKTIIAILIVGSILLTLFAASSSLVSASGGSITMANSYPQEGGTYLAVDHFIYQTTAVNTNTTVSVSVDNGPLIPMAFQGIRNEVADGDTVARDWYTWEATTPAITAPGEHAFQFFSHYYVWQDTDQYWAELNACSAAQSFTITNPSSTSSTSTPTTAPAVSQLQQVPELQPWAILPFIVAAILSLVVARKRIPQK